MSMIKFARSPERMSIGSSICLPAAVGREVPTLSKIRKWSILSALLVLGWGTIAPSAQAAARQLAVTLSSQGDSYDGLVQQAEAAASDLVRQSFAQDSGLSAVTVQILGEHNGQEAPLLLVQIARADWQRNPSIRAQTRYFGRSSAVLLGMTIDSNQTAALPSPASTTDLVSASMSDTEPNFYDQ